MKRFLFIAVLVLPIVFSGCSKVREKTIINLTGITWYETYVGFEKGEGEDRKYLGSANFGMKDVGERCIISTSAPAFHIQARDAYGQKIMSKTIYFKDDKAIVAEKDLYTQEELYQMGIVGDIIGDLLGKKE
ncbi:MAG: hypothetical protein FWC39_07570 [Bacteroidetes bacterium]|nr:hypothetical protein [Bacteroidota bacterium]